MDDTRERLLRRGDYVHGSFVKPEVVDGFINGVNPGDRSDVLGRFPFSEASADDAVDFAAIGSKVWRRVPLSDRAAAVKRFRDQLARFQERTARLIAREVGKPIWEARQEVLATIRALDLYLDEGVELLAPRVIEDIGARSDRLPRGVVGVISPYNMPLLVPVSHVGAAILAGNATVLKPSKFTPGVGQAIAELWDRCRLPRGVFNLVQGPGSVIGQRLAANPGLDALLLTGSYATATAIRQLTIDRPELPMLIQAGGSGTAIVLDDAELDRAVYEVMVGAFLTSGQRHNSTGRVIVTEGIYQRFVERLVRQTMRLSVGYAFEPDVFMGPVISENLRTRYRRFSRALASKGHVALCEAAHDSPSKRGFYVRPAIYRVSWDNGHPFLDEEPPGPTLLVYKAKSWEEAAALHNQATYRLATSLFTSLDNPLLPEIGDRLKTGALNVNRSTIGASMRLPSVGLGRSSNGVPSGLELLTVVTHARSQLVESRPFETIARLPGVHWDGTPTDTTVELEEETEDDDVLDVSSALELSEQ
ncbi:aldehyde dehydrogenase family protein [Myxococcota bacterium]|nr:aldehyde dehydrogenase family protein [Myxococcota bacterium]